MMNTNTPALRFIDKNIKIDHSHINRNGVVEGKLIMHWMEELAKDLTRKFVDATEVTVINVDKIYFHSHLKLNDSVNISAVVEYMGKHSFEIVISAMKNATTANDRTLVGSALLSTVALGKNGNPEHISHHQGTLQRVQSWFEERFPEAYVLNS